MGAPELSAPRGRRDGPRATNAAAFARLALVVAAGIVAAVVFHGLAVLVVVCSLIAMVMLHELGHFVAAKASGMKVTEYFLGFGPRLWSVRHGETDYGVKALPAGGYVRIVGMTNLEEVPPEDEARTYRQASFPRRFAVAVAGSAMHFVIAFGLLWGVFAFSGYPVSAVATTQVSEVVNFANGPSPARSGGLRPSDVIVSLDGRRVSSEAALRRAIEQNAGRPLHLGVERDGRRVELTVTPESAGKVRLLGANGQSEPFPGARADQGVIGAVFATATVSRTWNPLVSVVKAGGELGSLTKVSALGMGQVFSPQGLGNFVRQVATATSAPPAGSSGRGGAAKATGSGEVLSTVGAAEVAVQAAHQGVTPLLLILVLINLFIGMANLFPMLPLDGGHVAIAIYERLRSRRNKRYHADVAKLMPVAYAFLALIVLIGLGALYVNLLHPPSFG